LRLAEQLGQRLRGGEVIELVSDLGGGKTLFVKGLAKGLGIDDAVSSPSFTVKNVYPGPELKLYHYDFYRLHEAGLLKEEIAEALQDQTGVVVIEWADVVKDLLPVQHLSITIKTIGPEDREISYKSSEGLKYLFPDNT
jgi:tRNA threonylcarbamoyladenosine biosynthesis protein TsaE